MIVEVFYDLEKSLSNFKHEKTYHVRSIVDLGDVLKIEYEDGILYPSMTLKKDEIKRLRIL